MSRKSVVQPVSIGTLDISDDVVSVSVSTKNLDRYGYKLLWTGTAPVGVVTVEISNDELSDEFSAWETLPMDQMPITGNSGSHTLSITEISWMKSRIKYVSTSGTGSMEVIFLGAVVGA